ncbi:MAG: radical SAM protein [Thermodesulfobacteriota bacterium]
MRVLLVSANREDINMTTLPLGLAYVAAAAQEAGHEVRLLDLMGVKDTALALQKAIAELDPGAIGVSVRNIDDQNMNGTRFLLDQAKEAVSLCRRFSRAPIVLGGAGYSIFPESALTYLEADLGLQGEGEAAFPELLERLERKEDLAGLPGLYLPGRGPQGPRRFIKDLETLPWSRAAAWFDAAGPDPDLWLPIQTRRGCPLNCSYCSTPAIEGRQLRKCSPAAAAGRVKERVEAGFTRLFFTDNTFNLPPSFAGEFCREIINHQAQAAWRCILYPGGLDTELAGLMARAGCTGVSLGCEAGSEVMLRALNKRFTLADVRRCRVVLADSGIQCQGFLMLGGPGETRETVLESLAFIDSLDLDAIKITIGIRVYPNTDLAGQAVTRGLLSPDDDLLLPRFYLEPGLETWLPETIRQWAEGRDNCLTPWR